MDKSIMCATCARYQYGFNFCTCPVFNAQPTPRPATAEPPEWKGVEPHETYSGAATLVYVVPDPIAEFNARRIAKREEFAADAKERASWWNSLETVEDAVNTLQLSRAMSLDLHHTISDLIRPWRGK